MVEIHRDPSGDRRRVDALNAALAPGADRHPVGGLLAVTLGDGAAAQVDAATIKAIRRLGGGAPVAVSSCAVPTRAIAA